ncbi:MAG TPA: hypothetical protein VIJ64_02490 [Candidatus Lustribacter sp.]
MKKTVALPFAAIALTALVAAGCSGTGYTAATATGTPTPVPVPTSTCTPPPGVSIQQVFPQNGSVTAANLRGVVFAVAPSPLPTNWYIYATSTFGSTAGTTSTAFLATPVPVPGSTAGATPTPLPSPSDTPLFANPIYESASLGNFANNTKFTIFLANSNCFPGLPESTFTTTLTNSPTASPSPSPTPT